MTGLSITLCSLSRLCNNVCRVVFVTESTQKLPAVSPPSWLGVDVGLPLTNIHEMDATILYKIEVKLDMLNASRQRQKGEENVTYIYL